MQQLELYLRQLRQAETPEIINFGNTNFVLRLLQGALSLACHTIFAFRQLLLRFGKVY